MRQCGPTDIAEPRDTRRRPGATLGRLKPSVMPAEAGIERRFAPHGCPPCCAVRLLFAFCSADRYAAACPVRVDLAGDFADSRHITTKVRWVSRPGCKDRWEIALIDAGPAPVSRCGAGRFAIATVTQASS